MSWEDQKIGKPKQTFLLFVLFCSAVLTCCLAMFTHTVWLNLMAGTGLLGPVESKQLFYLLYPQFWLSFWI